MVAHFIFHGCVLKFRDKEELSLPRKRHFDGSEKVSEQEKARGCLKIADYIQIYDMLEDGEFGTQKESLTGRIVKKEDYQDRHHFLLRESGLEMLLVAIKRSCENVVLVEHGHDVRVTGSPGTESDCKNDSNVYSGGVISHQMSFQDGFKPLLE